MGFENPAIERATEKTITKAATLLRQGALVAIPTETVYGLGADATSDAAVAAILPPRQGRSLTRSLSMCPVFR